MTLSSESKSKAKLLLLALCLTVYAVGFSQLQSNIDAPPLGGKGGHPKGGQESLTASEVFANIPLEVLDMLRPSTRLDMLDYYSHADSLWVAPDALGGKSQLLQVAPDYLKVSVTPVSTLEIKILPSKKGDIIMTLYTVSDTTLSAIESRHWLRPSKSKSCLRPGTDGFPAVREPAKRQPMESRHSCLRPAVGAADTEVKFFDKDLKPLDSKKFLKAPTLKDFFNLKDSSLTEKQLEEKLPFQTIAYTTGPGETPLTATFTTLSTLSQEDRDQLTPLLTPSLSATWNPTYKFR